MEAKGIIKEMPHDKHNWSPKELQFEAYGLLQKTEDSCSHYK